MTHDPLCPNGDMTWLPDTSICLQCHLIARVREDERKRAVFIADRTINDSYDRDEAIAWINGTPPYWWKDGTP
jgi:hypothetical protein